RRRLVQTRVLDRYRRLRREQRDSLLVLLAEVAAFLLRQVQVAVGDAAQRGGNPTERGSSERSCRRSGEASRMSTPRMPRPVGRSPMAAWVCASIPVVRNRSSLDPVGSSTPSAAYFAPVSA